MRNMSINQENIRKFLSKQKNLSRLDKFSSSFCKNIYLDLKKYYQNKNIFLEKRNINTVKERFLYWDMFLF